MAVLAHGEEPTKGTPLETHALPAAARSRPSGPASPGNCEGRDLLAGEVDVVVTDGFTGNVALKTIEGGLKAIVGAIYDVFGSTDETRAAADVLLPALIPLAEQLDPDTTGGAMLLGVDGVCIISHGSSSARAVVNAVRVAAEMAKGGFVDHVATSDHGSPIRSRSRLR